MSRALLIATAAASVLAVAPVRGQRAPTSPPQAPSFEVASVKRNRSGEQRSGFNMPGNRLVATNVDLHELIAWAYGDPGPPPDLRQEFQLSGGPGWITTDRFDVEATTAGDLPDGVEKTRLKMRMLQTLLRDRFKLLVRHETREGPIYSLVRANRDGRLGPQLRRSDVDCTAPAPPSSSPSSSPPSGQVPPCRIQVGIGFLSIGTRSLPAMARLFSRAVGRPVIDRTALDGAFDLRLDFDQSGLPGFERPPGVPSPDLSDKPTLYTALQEQAGLKLEAGRGPIDVLVIESAEHPADN
jgi:uncharacterized protein (TIGR03435 family)